MDANENAIETAIETVDNRKPVILIIGAVLGTLVGLGAAYLMVQNAEKEGQAPKLTASDGVKLAVVVVGLLRTVATIGEGK
jgi:hypothetical protein